jgi:hypothetical protein
MRKMTVATSLKQLSFAAVMKPVYAGSLALLFKFLSQDRLNTV